MLLHGKDRKNLILIFETANTPIEVWVYGSRVTGTAHAGSDLDLVVHTKTTHKYFYRTLRKNKRQQHPYISRTQRLGNTTESSHKNIEQQYEVAYSNF